MCSLVEVVPAFAQVFKTEVAQAGDNDLRNVIAVFAIDTSMLAKGVAGERTDHRR